MMEFVVQWMAETGTNRPQSTDPRGMLCFLVQGREKTVLSQTQSSVQQHCIKKFVVGCVVASVEEYEDSHTAMLFHSAALY
jgi:hypothetical protein